MGVRYGFRCIMEFMMMSGVQEVSYIFRVGVSKEQKHLETQGIHSPHHFCLLLVILKGDSRLLLRL